MLKGVIFQELCVVGGDITQFIHFFIYSMHLKLLLFYSNHNHDDNVMVIPSAMGTRQGDPLGGVLFVLTHRKALRSIDNHFPLLSICIHCK